MYPFLQTILDEGTEIPSEMLSIINWVIFIHLAFVAGYFLLLTRDLIRGTDSAYPYKETEKLARKNK